MFFPCFLLFWGVLLLPCFLDYLIFLLHCKQNSTSGSLIFTIFKFFLQSCLINVHHHILDWLYSNLNFSQTVYIRFQAKINTLFTSKQSHDKWTQMVVPKVTKGCISEQFRFCARIPVVGHIQDSTHVDVPQCGKKGKGFVFFSSLSWYSNLIKLTYLSLLKKTHSVTFWEINVPVTESWLTGPREMQDDMAVHP